MEKRKLKLNVLDVAIIVVVICAVVALVFRGTVKDAFNEPEMVKLKVVVTTDKANTATAEIFKLNNTVYIDGDNQLQSEVVRVDEDENELIVILECKGYKKFGRIYTEHGEQLSGVSECTVQYDDYRAKCDIQSIELAE